MKKFAAILVAAGSLAIAAPVLACPNMNHAENATTPQTADKTKLTPAKADAVKAPAKAEPAAKTAAKSS